MIGRIGIAIIVICIIAAGSWWAYKNYSLPQNSNNEVPTLAPTQESVDIPKETSLQGEVVCLPHKDTSGPQTLECAIGLKATDGNYYALDSGNIVPPPYNTGETIRARGLMTPIEQLSSDHWQKYNVKGIFSIKGDIEKL